VLKRFPVRLRANVAQLLERIESAFDVIDRLKEADAQQTGDESSAGRHRDEQDRSNALRAMPRSSLFGCDLSHMSSIFKRTISSLPRQGSHCAIQINATTKRTNKIKAHGTREYFEFFLDRLRWEDESVGAAVCVFTASQ
jgi:hypothetical protein